MQELRSEHIRKRLFSAIIIVLCSLLLISVPLIIRSYQDYKVNQHAQMELEGLKLLADLANQVSRERAPANNLMSSSVSERAFYAQELHQYRQGVDQLLQSTIDALNSGDFHRVARYLDVEFRPALLHGRRAVDHYAQLKPSERNMAELDYAISEMFDVWDNVHVALQMVVNQSRGKDTAVSHYYTLILLLAEFRDQAGRAGSSVIAAVTFEEPMTETNLARYLQSKRQTHYLWELTDVLLPEHDKTPEFVELHHAVKNKFLDQALPMIDDLVSQSSFEAGYTISPTQLTTALGQNFATVVNLQAHILDISLTEAQRQTDQARKKLIVAILVTFIAIITTLFTMVYLRRYVFVPLIQARRLLIDLSRGHIDDVSRLEKSTSLFTAIQYLQEMLRQRDHMEFKLKNLAHTDSLTGVANRFALGAFIKVLDAQPTKFSNTCLIVVDIDYFKQVNDNHGHILGDQVIQWVADTLKSNVRTTDLLVRYGGDEFLVLIENVDLNQGLTIAEKIRSEVNVARFLTANDESIPVSVSIGVAVGANSWLSLLEKADQALFRAKAAGRNAVSS